MKKIALLGMVTLALSSCCYEQKSTPIVQNTLSHNTFQELATQEEDQPQGSLVIQELGPSSHTHKEKITLSNGKTYKIYPYHGWSLEQWSVGQVIELSENSELSYTLMLTNPKTQSTIRVKQI